MITNSDTRIILAALRSYEDAIGECLKDPELLPEERASFEKSAQAVDRLVKEMTPTIRIEVDQFDPAHQKWETWSQSFIEGECLLGDMIKTVFEDVVGHPFDYDEDYRINVSRSL